MPDVNPNNVPYATAKSSRILGKIRERPEDFRVDEVPAYPASGDGEHLWVRFEKTDMNTVAAVGALARAMDVDPRAASWAGLKDRRAVTTQWASFHRATEASARAANVQGVRVLEVSRHRSKLKTGHLAGNRFCIRVTDGGAHLETSRTLLAQLADNGCPNYYGEQRFGRDGDNAAQALAWVQGQARGPRDRTQRKFMFSALQAAMFNDWLAARVEAGELARAIDGDLLRKEDTGGLFVCEQPAVDDARAGRFEVSATGPMFGAKMRCPTGTALAREQALLSRWGLSSEILSNHKKHGEGTRRTCRIRPENWVANREENDLVLEFYLPKGAYATVILRELTKPTETGLVAHP